MKAVGVPTLLAAQRFAASSASLRRDAETARSELTSGRIADLPGVLGAAIAGALTARGALDAVNFQRQSLAQASLISTASQRALTALGDGAAALATEALAANGRRDETALTAASFEARDKVRNAFTILNSRAGGQSLFAGDATDRAALSNADLLLSDVEAIYAAAPDAAAFSAGLDTYFNDSSGDFNARIYSGGAGPAPTIEVAPGERRQFTIRAADQSVRDLLRGLSTVAVAAAAPSSELRNGVIFAGASRTISGVDALTERRTEIGVSQQRASAALQLLDAEETALTQSFNALTARDPYEAAARLQSLEAQLSASLAITARLSQLTLANFLR